MNAQENTEADFAVQNTPIKSELPTGMYILVVKLDRLLNYRKKRAAISVGTQFEARMRIFMMIMLDLHSIS